MTEFVGVGKMFAVPGEQKIAFMKGSQSQVKRTAVARYRGLKSEIRVGELFKFPKIFRAAFAAFFLSCKLLSVAQTPLDLKILSRLRFGQNSQSSYLL